MKKVLLAGLVVTMALAFSATAIPITHTGNVSSAENSFTQGFAVPLFNSSLGTLDSVTISFSSTHSGTISATNNGDADTFSADFSEFIRLYWPDSSYQYAFADPTSNYGSPYVEGGATVVYNVAPFYGSSAVLSSAPADTALFTGTGTTNLTFAVSYSCAYAATYGAPYTVVSDIDSSIDWTVTYNYTVPEPATMILLSIGGLSMLRRFGK